VQPLLAIDLLDSFCSLVRVAVISLEDLIATDHQFAFVAGIDDSSSAFLGGANADLGSRDRATDRRNFPRSAPSW
jgi:hypothetical protein